MKKINLGWVFGLLWATALPAQSLTIINDAELIQQFNTPQKPRVINFWATWCKPCMEEMPYFRRADSVLGNKVEFVFVAFDRVRDTARVKEKIAELKIPGKHFLIKTSDFGKLIDAVDSSWGGALPITWMVFEQFKLSKPEAFKQYNDLMVFIKAFLNQEE